MIRSGKLPLGNVEAWLTSLAAPQPFDSPSQRHRRRAAFLDVAELIASSITACERLALAADAPRWLKRLVTCWHYGTSTVLTFNYDTIVEATMLSLVLRGADATQSKRLERAIPRTATGGYPPLFPRSGRRFAEQLDAGTLRLIKLHGSVNWWSRTSSNDVFSIVDGESVSAWGTAPDHRPPMTGLNPMIVPPIADKSGQYTNSTIETLWFEAAESLQKASTLILFGYSLPQTDTTTAALLAENLNPEAAVVIVDRHPSDVAERLRTLVQNRVIEIGDEDRAAHAREVERLVDGIESGLAQREPTWFQGAAEDLTNEACYASVRTSDNQKLGIEEIADNIVQTRRALPIDESPVSPAGPPLTPDTVRACRWVRLPDGELSPIYRIEREQNTNERSVVSIHTGPM